MSVAPAVSIAFCLLTLPGFLVLLAAGVRLRTVVGLSGAVSASVLAVSAVAAPYLDLGWNLLTVLVGTLIAAALTLLVRLLLLLAFLLPGIGWVLYVALWALLPWQDGSIPLERAMSR